MAKKEKKEKKGSGKKAVSGILIAVIAIVLIVVLLATALLAIIMAIVQLIVDIVVDLFNAIKNAIFNPIGQFKTDWARYQNRWSFVWDTGYFDENEYEALRKEINVSIVITDEQVKNMMSGLKDSGISASSAGLEDSLLNKKMILTNNRGEFLKDVNILIELTDDEYSAISKEKDLAEPFDVIPGKEGEYGEEGKYYLKASGFITIVDDSTGKELIFYDNETLDKIYEKEYKKALKWGKTDYANSVWNYLKKCYTLQLNSASGEDIEKLSEEELKESTVDMIKYTKVKDYEASIKEYGNLESAKEKEVIYGNTTYSQTVGEDSYDKTTIDYKIVASDYTIPIEFMIDLLQISQSKEFVNEFIKKVSDITNITLGLYNKEDSELWTEELKGNINSSINYTNNYSIEVSKNNSRGTTLFDVKQEIDEEKNDIKVTSKINNDLLNITVSLKSEEKEDCTIRLYNNRKQINVVELNSENNYSYSWSKLLPFKYSITDKSEFKSETMVSKNNTQFEVRVKKIETWYLRQEQEYEIEEEENSKESSETTRADGWYFTEQNSEEVFNEDSIIDINQENVDIEEGITEANQFWNNIYYYITYGRNNWKTAEGEPYEGYVESIRSEEDTLISVLKELELSNEDTITPSEFAELYGSKLEGMNLTYDNNEMEKKVKEFKKRPVEKPDPIIKSYDNTDEFVSLLLNNKGEEIAYSGIYGDMVSVGERLENSSGFSDFVLKSVEDNQRTLKINDVMKLIVYKYKNGIRTGTNVEFDFSIFDSDDSIEVEEESTAISTALNKIAA